MMESLATIAGALLVLMAAMAVASRIIPDEYDHPVLARRATPPANRK